MPKKPNTISLLMAAALVAVANARANTPETSERMRVKDKVDTQALDYRIVAVIEPVQDLWRKCAPGIEPWITSARREWAPKFSYHHIGQALDFRMNNLSAAQIYCVKVNLNDFLPTPTNGRYDWTTHPEYPVGHPQKHLHIEIDDGQVMAGRYG